MLSGSQECPCRPNKAERNTQWEEKKRTDFKEFSIDPEVRTSGNCFLKNLCWSRRIVPLLGAGRGMEKGLLAK